MGIFFTLDGHGIENHSENDDESDGKSLSKYNKKGSKKKNLKENFELINGRYWCKSCGESVSARWPHYYLKHIRDRHPELTEMAAPYVFWSPEQEEELVRLVGESIRRNKDVRYLKGVKAINWDRIEEQMNRSNDWQLSSQQTKSKWGNMVTRLPMPSIGEK